jgi:DNA polymerase III epsilon subunit-like protein
MSLFVTDVESDGQIIGRHSIVCFGVVKLIPELNTNFYGQMKPISDQWIPEALAVSGFSREEHNTFPEPEYVMKSFYKWIEKNSVGRPILISDNNGYDASWINYYFYIYCGKNPFGWSSRRIGDLYCGMMKDTWASWKKLRVTKHTHNPVDDAMGNAEALLKMKEMGLKIDTK